jgi:50S ribosomal protein L16 3-hydroxylase
MPRPAIEVRARKGQPLGMTPARFLRDYWQKWPLLIRNAFPDFTPPLSPDELAGLACVEGALSRIVVRQSGSSSRPGNGRDPVPGTERMDSRPRRNEGKWSVLNGPFDDATFEQLPEKDWTLLVQDVDKWDADTAALLDHFSFIPSWRIDDVMVSYAVDAGGVGAHADQYDVFLLQGQGQRRWAIDARRNPCTDFRNGAELKLLREFRASHEWVLAPGDMLYLPPGVPHDGTAIGECMTFSIGMRAPSAAEMLADFAHGLVERLPDALRYADPDLQVVRESGEIDDRAIARVMRSLPWIHVDAGKRSQTRNGGVPVSSLRTWFGCFITRYRTAQVPVPRQRPVDRTALAQRLSRSVFERDPWNRCAWCRNGRTATLFVAGHAYAAPPAWARMLSRPAREFDGALLAGLPEPARGVVLLADLIDAGHLRPVRRRSRN